MSAQTCRKSLLVAVALEHVTVVDLTPVTTVTRPLPTSQQFATLSACRIDNARKHNVRVL